MRPPPAVIRWGTTAWQQRKTPLRSIASTRSHSASSSSANWALWGTAAAQTRRSIRPKAPATVSRPLTSPASPSIDQTTRDKVGDFILGVAEDVAVDAGVVLADAGRGGTQLAGGSREVESEAVDLHRADFGVFERHVVAAVGQ